MMFSLAKKADFMINLRTLCQMKSDAISDAIISHKTEQFSKYIVPTASNMNEVKISK